MFTLTEVSALEQEGIKIINFSKTEKESKLSFQITEQKNIDIVCRKTANGAFSLHTQGGFYLTKDERHFFLQYVKEFIENLPTYRLHATTTQDFVTIGKSIESIFSESLKRAMGGGFK